MRIFIFGLTIPLKQTNFFFFNCNEAENKNITNLKKLKYLEILKLVLSND